MAWFLIIGDTHPTIDEVVTVKSGVCKSASGEWTISDYAKPPLMHLTDRLVGDAKSKVINITEMGIGHKGDTRATKVEIS